MIKFERIIDGEEVSCTVYTKQEAKEYIKTKVKQWNNCNTGDWGLTNDGFVTRCIEKKIVNYGGYKRVGSRPDLLYFEGGVEFTNTMNFNFMDKYRSKNWYEPCDKNKKETYLSDPNVKKIIEYAKFQLGLGYVSEEQIAKLCSPHADTESVEQIKTILRSTTVRDVLKEEIRDIMERKGITDEILIDDYLDIKKRAKEDGKLDIELKITDRFLALSQMGNKVKKENGLLPNKEIQQASLAESVQKDLEQAKQ